MPLFLLLACVAPDDALVSEAGFYTVTLATEPEMPLVGSTTLFVDAPGTTALAVEGSMAGMHHGFGEDPVVEGGDGAWEVHVDCPMSGTWRLTFALDGEAGPDTLVADLDVR